jgi:hypothetical protein
MSRNLLSGRNPTRCAEKREHGSSDQDLGPTREPRRLKICSKIQDIVRESVNVRPMSAV